MQDRLTKLVGIFESLDFRSNRAEGDDLLGDAYEYLMRNFATESGKSKGQFYTPAEVSRVIAKVVGVRNATRTDQTVYDPTCGSGSLLLKVHDEAPVDLSIYGQENDNATWSLAKMNLILHGKPTAEIWKDNTLSDPYWKNPDKSLKTFDFAIANPPFSSKNWTNGLDPANDDYKRFDYGIPPSKNGDYAFLLHIIKSLKSKGKAAVILPHGVLFRGNKEGDIRRNLVKQGLIKGIIGLPANLFYGTGIPACIIVVDKENAHARTGIFMIEASKSFLKDGNKNRLRAQDIHKIVDVFNRQTEISHYSRMVPVAEIADPSNDYNLNIPRYIDTTEPEDIHDLEGHLMGGIPNCDIDNLQAFWDVFPSLRKTLIKNNGREGYCECIVESNAVKATILAHPEFKSYANSVDKLFQEWKNRHESALKNLVIGAKPKGIILTLSEDLLVQFSEIPLLHKYDVFQRLMDYWEDTMQDDLYLISAEGWNAGRTLRAAYDKETPDFSVKKGQKTLKYVGELIPGSLIINRFFAKEKIALEQLESEVDAATQQKEEFEEEHGGDDGALNGLEGRNGITKGNVLERVLELKEMILKTCSKKSIEFTQATEIKKTTFGSKPWNKGIKDEDGLFEELDILFDFLQLAEDESNKKKKHKKALDNLYKKVIEKYPELTETEIKTLVVEDKWFTTLQTAIEDEVDRITQRLVGRIKELETRYAQPLPEIVNEVNIHKTKVESHLKSMGLTWE